MTVQIRLARPVRDLARARAMYCEGLGMQVLGAFEDHAGFDGVMVGWAAHPWHLEFTRCRYHPVEPRPTLEDLLVIYEPDRATWLARRQAMRGAGFGRVDAFNPYWDARGATFEDADGYRVVLQRGSWEPAA